MNDLQKAGILIIVSLSILWAVHLTHTHEEPPAIRLLTVAHYLDAHPELDNTVSIAIKDGIIDDNEYKNILNEYNELSELKSTVGK